KRWAKAVGRKIELKPDGTMHAEGLLSYDPFVAAAELEKASADNWPMGVAFPSPKEGEISARAWRELGLKVVPASQAEQADKDATAVKVVGGVSPPPNYSAPTVYLLSLNKIDTKDFDQLDAALKALQGQKLVVAHCVTHDNAHQPIWIDVALDG